MNDIERFAAALTASRQHCEVQTPTSDVPQTLGKQIWSANDTGVGASNDTLQHDLATDFGLLNPIPSQFKESATPAKGSIELNEDLHRVLSPVAPYENQKSSLSQEASGAVNNLSLVKLAAEGFITPGTKRNLMTEQYRRIKRPLLKNMELCDRADARKNVIMVTSSVSGEGKTFTSINLAMSLAMEREKNVLLVDMDVLKNSAGIVLGVDNESPGLIDLLVDNVSDPSELILKTNITNFSYLPSGQPQHDSNELLSSGRVKELFDELSNRYNNLIIILDCPPVLQTNEATIISDYAGQVVFVVAEEDTSQSYVVEALSQLPKDSYVGIVLNKSRNRIMGSEYGYTYEYG